jgi:DNA polymerase I-like protein with 3'-5' exonuclease and polymerase domains
MLVLDPLKLPQLDTETTGLDEHTKKILTIQLGNKENQVVFDWTTLTLHEKRKLKKYLESDDRTFLGWNLMFDLRFLYSVDIWPKHVWDGYIGQKLIWLGYSREDLIRMFIEQDIDTIYAGYSLKAACHNYCDIDLDKSVRGKIINEGLTEEVVVYAAGDVMYIEDIKNEMDKILDAQELQTAMFVECEFIKGLAYFQYCGVLLSVEKWKAKMAKDLAAMREAEEKLNEWVVEWESQQDEDYEIRYPELEEEGNDVAIEKLKKKLLKQGFVRWPKEDLEKAWGDTKVAAYRRKVEGSYTTVNLQGDLFEGFDTRRKCKVNWRSPEQVIGLFKKLGIQTETFDKKTKKKKDSIDKTILKPQKDKFPIIPIYLEYRKAAQVVSNFGQNWLDAINKGDGRVHPELNPIGTDTSRVSSGGGQNDLNIQNIPHDPETRACFVSAPGNVWISADYQSQESRIIASVANDPAMLDLFINGSGDVHSLVAKMSYSQFIPNDLPVEDVKSFSKASAREGGIDYRQEAKGIEFAINYGGDFNTIANNKGIPLEEAKQIYENFMEGFPGVASYQDYCRKAVMRDGYVLMNPQTRHRAHIPELKFIREMQEKMNDP